MPPERVVVASSRAIVPADRRKSCSVAGMAAAPAVMTRALPSRLSGDGDEHADERPGQRRRGDLPELRAEQSGPGHGQRTSSGLRVCRASSVHPRNSSSRDPACGELVQGDAGCGGAVTDLRDRHPPHDEHAVTAPSGLRCHRLHRRTGGVEGLGQLAVLRGHDPRRGTLQLADRAPYDQAAVVDDDHVVREVLDLPRQGRRSHRARCGVTPLPYGQSAWGGRARWKGVTAR